MAANRTTTLLERLYGPGETRPFAGLTTDQSGLRDSETSAARAHMQRAGVKNTAFMSDEDVRSAYFSKPKSHWDSAEEHNTKPEYRYYSMHPANAEGLINDLRASGAKFNVRPGEAYATHNGRRQSRVDHYGDMHQPQRTIPRLHLSVKAPASVHDDLMAKHGQHLVYEGKAYASFFTEAMDSVTVAGVDGIPRTTPVKNEDDQLDNNDGAIYNGNLLDAADTLNKVFDAETQARLAALYGPKWHQLVSQSLAEIPRLQPNNREAVNEHIELIKESVENLTEELAAALNYVNSVNHGDARPKFKSAMAWLHGVEHLYGADVAGKANDTLYSKGHAAAVDFVSDYVQDNLHKVGDNYPNDNYSRQKTGPYSQLHAVHMNEDFRPGLLNPGGVFGRQGDEVYTKTHGNFSTDYNRIGPYGKDSKGAPESVLYTDPHNKTITKHLDGLKADGKIQGYKWEHYVDGDSRSRARLQVTATHAQHKAIAAGLNTVLNTAREQKYGERDAWFAGQRDADAAPNSPNTKPITVSGQDRAVRKILHSNPEATDAEVGKAWDEHVRVGVVQPHEVPNLVRRYRSRVAYHQGKGNLAE